jgi:hypothetical protein
VRTTTRLAGRCFACSIWQRAQCQKHAPLHASAGPVASAHCHCHPCPYHPISTIRTTMYLPIVLLRSTHTADTTEVCRCLCLCCNCCCHCGRRTSTHRTHTQVVVVTCSRCLCPAAAWDGQWSWRRTNNPWPSLFCSCLSCYGQLCPSLEAGWSPQPANHRPPASPVSQIARQASACSYCKAAA